MAHAARPRPPNAQLPPRSQPLAPDDRDRCGEPAGGEEGQGGVMKRRSLLGLFGAALLAPFVPPLPGELQASTTTLSTLDETLKEYYSDNAVRSLVYDYVPRFFQMIQKREDFT